MQYSNVGKVLVAYHSPCMDGYGAACAHFNFTDLEEDRVVYQGVSYGFLKSLPEMEKFPWIDDHITDIIFLDICPTQETLDFLTHDKSFRVLILDHHKTAKTILNNYSNENVRYLIAEKFSGASLTQAIGPNIDMIAFHLGFKPSGALDHFDPLMGGFVTNMHLDVIKMINRARIDVLYGLLEVRDIWIKDDPEMKFKADFLSAYFKFHDIAKNKVGDLNQLIINLGGLEHIILAGKTIDEVQNAIVDDAIKASYQTEIVLRNNKKLSLCIGVCPDGMGSMFGESWNSKQAEGSLAISMFYNLRANEIGLSLRSNNKLARAVAEELKGGGHDDAAGAVIRPVTKVGDLPSINAIIRRIESILIHM